MGGVVEAGQRGGIQHRRGVNLGQERVEQGASRVFVLHSRADQNRIRVVGVFREFPGASRVEAAAGRFGQGDDPSLQDGDGDVPRDTFPGRDLKLPGPRPQRS